MHFGVAPEYRGQDSLFWTLYRRDYDRIGFTLHVVDEGIDSGPILARGYPALARRDSEATLWAKCARMAVDTCVELMQQAEGATASIAFPNVAASPYPRTRSYDLERHESSVETMDIRTTPARSTGADRANLCRTAPARRDRSLTVAGHGR